MEPYDILAIIIAGFSLICCIVLFRILVHVRLNGFLILIAALNVAMTIRSFSYFFKIIPSFGEGLFLLVEMVSDLSGGLWTNIIGITLLRTVYTLDGVNIRKEMPFYIVLIFCTTIPIAIYEIVDYGLSDDRLLLPYRLFYYYRVAIFLINCILYVLSIYFATNLEKRVLSQEVTTAQAQSLKLLVFRMRMYPISQVFMRIGPLWLGYNSETVHSTAAEYTDSITSPICGIGYFIVFLYVQPLIRKRFIQRTIARFHCLTCYLFAKRAKSGDISSSGSERQTSVQLEANISERISRIENTYLANYGEFNDEESKSNRQSTVRYSTSIRGSEVVSPFRSEPTTSNSEIELP